LGFIHDVVFKIQKSSAKAGLFCFIMRGSTLSELQNGMLFIPPIASVVIEIKALLA
jgi:hypothetical protein